RTMEEARTREHALQARIEECEREIEQVRRAQVETAISASSDALDLGVEGEEPTAAAEPVAEGEAVVPETPAPEAPATPAPETPAESDIVVGVLDVDRGWDRIAKPGRTVETVAPDGMAAKALGRIQPAHVVANLGAPRVLDTLIALRADGSAARLWGCVADATSGRALVLGRIEPAPR